MAGIGTCGHNARRNLANPLRANLPAPDRANYLRKESFMVRPRLYLGALCIATLLAAQGARAEDGAQPAASPATESAPETKNAGQEKLDQATEAKLSAEDVGDLNKVITLCQEALEAGLDDANTKFANELLSSTLTQRAELACSELFERQMPQARARKILQGALAD